jgi:hypothetical protein
MLMTWFGVVLLVLGFLLVLKLFGIVEKSRKVLSITRSAKAVMADGSLDDTQKERLLQRSATQLFGLFLWLVVGSLVAVAVPLIVVWLMDVVGLLTVDAVIEATFSFQFIGLTVLVGIVYLVARRQWR